MSRKILQMDGIKYVITVAGYSLLGGSGENVALGVIGLEDWSKRTTKALSIEGITGSLSQKFGSYKNAELNFFAPPSVPGIGQSNGLSLELVATNTDATPQDLDKALKQYLYAANSSPEMAYAFSTFTADTPHVYLNIDRTKLQSYDIPVSALYNTLQSNLGATYINNITLSGQVNKVILQADFNYRRSIENIKNLYVKSNNGSLIKIDSFADVSTEISPKIIYRYDLYTAAAITAQAAEGISSGQAMDTMEKLAEQVLPQGFSIDWTALSLQEAETRGLVGALITLAVIFCLFVFGCFIRKLDAGIFGYVFHCLRCSRRFSRITPVRSSSQYLCSTRHYPSYRSGSEKCYFNCRIYQRLPRTGL